MENCHVHVEGGYQQHVNTVTKAVTKTFFNRSTGVSALLVCMENVKSDAALSEGARGARKIRVTEIERDKEKEAFIFYN